MGSAPDVLTVSPVPSLGGALRAAAYDFYDNSWRLVAANVIWGLGLILLYFILLVLPIAALALLPLLAFPTLTMFQIAALVTREQSASFWDGVGAWRRLAIPTLVCGVGSVFVAVVLLTNLIGGLSSGDMIGWGFASFATWGLLLGSLWLLCFWPLLADPDRAGIRGREAAGLASYMVLAHPVRIGVLAVVIAVFLVVSTIVFVALVTLSLGFVAILTCRYILPTADRLEARLAERGVVFASSAASMEAARARRELADADGAAPPVSSFGLRAGDELPEVPAGPASGDH